jgi:hypothetical protein
MPSITFDVVHAEKFSEWLKNRQGIAQWKSIDLSDPGAGCVTPAKAEDGTDYPKPYWKYANTPAFILTSPDDVFLTVSKEVKRFYVAVRRGAQGFKIKCTDASSRKIENTLEKLGNEAYYEFDYETQEAVFYLPDSKITLTEWRKQHDNSR